VKARYALSAFGLTAALAVLLRMTVVYSVVMKSDAMEPTVRAGEFLIATRGDATHPRHGAVILVRTPLGTRLARVAGVAGDRIEFRDDHLHVNDTIYDPRVTVRDASVDPSMVPPDHVYVVNDRTEDVEDSRTWGPLATDLVEGQARLIWLSLDWFDDAGETRAVPRVRWDRTFRLIH